MNQIEALIELDSLCQPASESLSDYERINRFVACGNVLVKHFKDSDSRIAITFLKGYKNDI